MWVAGTHTLESSPGAPQLYWQEVEQEAGQPGHSVTNPKYEYTQDMYDLKPLKPNKHEQFPRPLAYVPPRPHIVPSLRQLTFTALILLQEPHLRQL